MRILLAVLLSVCWMSGGPASAQEPPPSDAPAAPAAPAAAEEIGSEGVPVGSDLEQARSGRASGPPPLGNEAGMEEAIANGVVSEGGSPRPSTATFPTAASNSLQQETYLYIGLGVGLLALLGIGWLWSRRGGSLDDALPDTVQRLPEPAFIGRPMPSLSDGVQVWVVDAEHEELLLEDLLATLADAHRVLVVAASDRDLPNVAGGPVYRVQGLRPMHLEDPLDHLDQDGGRAPAVLWVLPVDRLSTLEEYADRLPPGVGGVVLVTESSDSPESVDVPFPRITMEAQGDGWRARRGARVGGLRRTHDGRLAPTDREVEE